MVYETYENLFKPLPPPPPGKVWRKVRVQPEDSDAAHGVATRWELIDRPSSLSTAPPAEQDNQTQETAENGDPDFIEVGVLRALGTGACGVDGSVKASGRSWITRL